MIHPGLRNTFLNNPITSLVPLMEREGHHADLLISESEWCPLGFVQYGGTDTVSSGGKENKNQRRSKWLQKREEGLTLR
jgi:hypothetical protein